MKGLVVVGVVALLAGSAAQLNAKSGRSWSPAPPSLPKGAKISVVSGDPSKAGPFVMLLRIPPAWEIHPHRHPSTEHVKVIYGALTYGMGPVIDRDRVFTLGPGKSFVAHANMDHYVSTTQGATMRISGTGPFQITYANPRHDPRNTL